jgi:hypothetical protein
MRWTEPMHIKILTQNSSRYTNLSPNREGSIAIAPIPARQAIAPGRFCIYIDDQTLPIQFTELEARSLLPRLRGKPRERILQIVEQAFDRGGAL